MGCLLSTTGRQPLSDGSVNQWHHTLSSVPSTDYDGPGFSPGNSRGAKLHRQPPATQPPTPQPPTPLCLAPAVAPPASRAWLVPSVRGRWPSVRGRWRKLGHGHSPWESSYLARARCQPKRPDFTAFNILSHNALPPSRGAGPESRQTPLFACPGNTERAAGFPELGHRLCRLLGLKRLRKVCRR